jgi:hypothetical protein
MPSRVGDQAGEAASRTHLPHLNISETLMFDLAVADESIARKLSAGVAASIESRVFNFG